MKKDDVRALHLASAAHAKRALRNFTLSNRVGKKRQPAAHRVTDDDETEGAEGSKSAGLARGANRPPQARPKTYIAQGANVADEQSKSIRDQLDVMPLTGPGGPGMSLMIAKDEVAEIIQGNEIDLTDLLDRMEKAKTGTQFYTSGTTIQDSMANQAKVDKFFSKYEQMGAADEEDDDADE
jgi:hypothetical protein